MLPNGTSCFVRSTTVVEYRCSSGHGERLVRISLDTSDPRVLAQMETIRGNQVTPMSLSLSEVLLYIRDALERTGRTPADNLLLAAFQVLWAKSPDTPKPVSKLADEGSKPCP